MKYKRHHEEETRSFVPDTNALSNVQHHRLQSGPRQDHNPLDVQRSEWEMQV